MSGLSVRIFVSYCHSDVEYLGEESLLGFLRGLENDGVDFWTDEHIAAGDKWDDEIRSKISESHIALVLVSQSFLNSEYCTRVEITEFLEPSRRSGMVIVPVILSPCDWESHSWLRSTQHLPRDGATIEELEAGARKRLYLAVLENLRKQIEKLRATPGAQLAPSMKHQISGERRQVTVLQCELTTAGDAHDAEDVVQFLPEYRSQTSQIIKRLEGYVAQKQGRRILAYFGCLRLHEDDARRAVMAARQIATLARSLDGSLAMKVAVHTGSMVLSTESSDEEPVMIGDVPDVVDAILRLTPANAIQISETTQDLVEKDVICTAAGSVGLEDGGHSLQFFAVDEPISGVNATPAAPARKSFVARDQEMEILRQRWELAREGAGQVVYIRGEAGLGKTRLVEEFTAEVMTTSVVCLKCRCSPYHQNTELYPLIDLFYRRLQFTNPEQQANAAQRLEALVREMEMPHETVVPLLSLLLALPAPPKYPPVTLSPEGRKKNTLAAVIELILRQAARQPVLLIVEDLHWIDASTIAFLDLLMQTQATAPVLTILTFRAAEFDPPWRQLSYLSEISLRRLGSKEAGKLISILADGRPLPTDIVKEIVEKADGVPLFAEELTKMVTESEHSAPGGEKLAVPSTLEGSLIARLDRLDTAKEVAQVASVIGREFFRGLLAETVSFEETALVRDLERLLQSEIILRRGLPSDASYLFKHALIQQAAYESILSRDARRLHGKIAEALESKFADRAERQPEVAAFHFTRAGVTEKAINYWQKAAERSIKNSANPEAVAHLTQCLELLEELPAGPERDRREMRLRTALALPLIATKGYAAEEVDEALSRAQHLCTEVGDDAELFRVLRLLWPFRTVRGDHAKAFEAARQIQTMAKSQDAAALRLEADRVLGSSYFYMGRLSEARQHFESAIDFYDRERDHAHVLVYGQDPGVTCLANETLTLWFMGHPDQARACGAKAVALARELGHPYSLCYSLFFCSWFYIFVGGLDELQAAVEEMIDVSRHQSFPFWETMGVIVKGWLSAQRGDAAGGLAMMTEWLEKSRRLGARLYLPAFHCLMAEIHLANGDAEAGLAMVEEGLSVLTATGETFCEPELHRLKGDLLAMQTPGSPAAEECLLRARDIAAAQGSKSLNLRATISLSRFRSLANGREEAPPQAILGLVNP